MLIHIRHYIYMNMHSLLSLEKLFFVCVVGEEEEGLRGHDYIARVEW